MEPRQQGPGPSYENASTPEGQGYRLPEVSPDLIPGYQVEKYNDNPVVQENQPAPIVVPSIPVPVVLSSDDDSSAASTQASDDITSLAAADDDLIEKEWVDKAKRIIEDTKDDPYRREQEIGSLQREYIKKRYGRIIGEREDNT